MRNDAHALRSPACPGVRHRPGDAGETLIEILITLVIMSITVVALVGAFSSSIGASSVYRGLSVTDTLVRTISEQVTAQFQQHSNTYLSCPNATPGNYTNGYYVNGVLQSTPLLSALVVPAPYGTPTGAYSASISSVTYWSGTGFGAGCTTGSTVPEEMTISISGPPGVRTETIAMVVEGNGQSGAAVRLDPPGLSVKPWTGSDPGGLDVTITAPDNVPTTPGFTQYYTVQACTDQQMTQGCSPAAPGWVAGEQELAGLVPGTPYYVSVFANASPGYLASATVTTPTTTTSSGVSPNPSVVSVSPSTTAAGALTVSYTIGAAPANDTFTAIACTNSSMTSNCVSQVVTNQSGAQVSGLTPGTAYFVEISAAAQGSYSGGTSFPYTPPVKATVQLNQTTGVSVSPSTSNTGALVVTFAAPSNAPSSQGYTVNACTDKAMSAACVSQPGYVSGNQFTGLTPGASYYVTVTAVASSGYLASTSTVTPTATEATVQLTTPVITTTSTGVGSGKIIVNFTGSGNGPANQTYTLIACTNTQMNAGCVTNTSYKSGANQGGLAHATTYYVTITANASSGYLASSPSAQKSVTSS